MKIFAPIPPLCLIVTCFAVSTLACAQSPAPATCALGSGSGTVCGLHVNPAPSRPLSSPFPLDTHTTAASTLHFVPVDQLPAADRTLLAASQPRITALAREQGFDFPGQAASGQGSEKIRSHWIAQQAVCTALPDHLLIRYQRAPDTHREASFTVSVPRSAAGRIRFVPVERKGFTLYTPARRNRLTLVVFNDLLREDAHTIHADWLGLGLCYAALAGDRVQAATALVPSTGDPQPTYTTAALSLSWKQPPAITFVGLPPGGANPLQWTLIFTPGGLLHKVQTKDAYPLKVTPAGEDSRKESPTVAKGQIVDLK